MEQDKALYFFVKSRLPLRSQRQFYSSSFTIVAYRFRHCLSWVMISFQTTPLLSIPYLHVSVPYHIHSFCCSTSPFPCTSYHHISILNSIRSYSFPCLVFSIPSQLKLRYIRFRLNSSTYRFHFIILFILLLSSLFNIMGDRENFLCWFLSI